MPTEPKIPIRDTNWRYQQLIGIERGLYWKWVRLVLTPTQAIVRALSEAWDLDNINRGRALALPR